MNDNKGTLGTEFSVLPVKEPYSSPDGDIISQTDESTCIFGPENAMLYGIETPDYSNQFQDQSIGPTPSHGLKMSISTLPTPFPSVNTEERTKIPIETVEISNEYVFLTPTVGNVDNGISSGANLPGGVCGLIGIIIGLLIFLIVLAYLVGYKTLLLKLLIDRNSAESNDELNSGRKTFINVQDVSKEEEIRK